MPIEPFPAQLDPYCLKWASLLFTEQLLLEQLKKLARGKASIYTIDNFYEAVATLILNSSVPELWQAKIAKGTIAILADHLKRIGFNKLNMMVELQVDTRTIKKSWFLADTIPKTKEAISYHTDSHAIESGAVSMGNINIKLF